MSKVSEFIKEVLSRRKEESKTEGLVTPILVQATQTVPTSTAGIVHKEEPKIEQTAKELYSELSRVRAMRTQIGEQLKLAKEKKTELRQRVHANSMNLGYHGSVVGDWGPDSKQKAANDRANLRMRKVFESTKLEQKYAEEELNRLLKQDQELEERERNLQTQFVIQSSREALENEKNQAR
jgi:hypothetical protein